MGIEKDFKISNGSVLEKKDEIGIKLKEKISFPIKIQFKLNQIKEMDNGISIEKFLREDGRLDLPKGKAIGSINAKGFKLISGEGEEPRFEATGEVENFLAPGDEWWDDRFYLPGANGTVYALLWDGQNLYVGGSFNIAGGKPSSYIALWRPCYTSPSTPQINSIEDINNCSSNGVNISFTSGEPYTRNDLYVDGELKMTNVSSPFTYIPDDNNNHSYVIRSIYYYDSCTTNSASVNLQDIDYTPTPAISGNNLNTRPETNVLLSTENYSYYQWFYNGQEIIGANLQSYYATLSGDYKVMVTNSYGCEVFVDFCENSEVSPKNGIFPLRIVKDQNSSTGYYIYFQRMDSINGFNIYEGEIGNWYSYSTGTNICNATFFDLGTGELRAELNPSEGNHYYLITAFGGDIEGPSGFDSNNGEIPKGHSSCTP